MPHVIDLGKRAFQRLPIEVNENIASFLDTDKDFANFNAICRETHDTIQSHRCGAWRAQWKQEYDLPLGMTGSQLKAQYQERRMYLYTKAFRDGLADAEMNCIRVLKQLVIESFAGSFKKRSNNMVRLQRFLKESNILQTFNICLSRSEEKCTPDLQALHVCLAHWYFDFSENLPHVAFCYFPISQIVAYSRPMDFPIFFDNGHLSASIVNMQAVLHMINFWRYHMQEPVRNLCLGLNSKEKPQGWKRPVFDAFACVKGLSRMWKGAYAYMSDPHDVDELRASSDDLDNVPIERMMYFDEIDEAGLQNIEFDFAEDHNIAGWPKAFEDNLQAIPSISLYTYNRYVTQRDTVEVKGTAEEKKPTDGPINGTRHISKRKRRPLSTTTSIPPLNDTQNSAAIKKLNSATSPEIVGPRKGKDYLPFSGSISDLSGYQGISGILHNLPDQSGIPGFQRISFMKYAINIPKQQDEVTPWASEDHHDQIDEDYYCYQGVVLPGGHIILGRWWAPFDDEEQYCTGPFMLWAVEE